MKDESSTIISIIVLTDSPFVCCQHTFMHKAMMMMSTPLHTHNRQNSGAVVLHVKHTLTNFNRYFFFYKSHFIHILVSGGNSISIVRF